MKANVFTPYCLSRAGGSVNAQRIDLIIPTERHRPSLSEVERAYSLAVLHENGGNIPSAARALGVGRATLYRRVRQWEKEERPQLDGDSCVALANMPGVRP